MQPLKTDIFNWNTEVVIETSSQSRKKKFAQSCLTLWDPMDYNQPVFSVHVILQARILEWVAIRFSRRPS